MQFGRCTRAGPLFRCLPGKPESKVLLLSNIEGIQKVQGGACFPFASDAGRPTTLCRDEQKSFLSDPTKTCVGHMGLTRQHCQHCGAETLAHPKDDQCLGTVDTVDSIDLKILNSVLKRLSRRTNSFQPWLLASEPLTIEDACF